MIGTSLVEIRDYVETLASPTGEYFLVCGRTGYRPAPAAGLRFERRRAAQSAARATEQYRAALRRYDPQLPHYDVIVCQDSGPVETAGRTGSEHHSLVEFCHRTAAVVFETLSDRGHDTVETAVMDAYLDLAETVDDLDDLCLCLLESMATELGTRLPPAQQVDVLVEAATRLPSGTSTAQPIDATFSLLRARGLLESYSRSPSSVDPDSGTQSTVVRLSGYVLSPQNGCLPVLPIALDLYRRELDWSLSSIHAVEDDGRWRLTLVLARDTEPTTLASAPIRFEAT